MYLKDKILNHPSNELAEGTTTFKELLRTVGKTDTMSFFR